MKKIRGIIAVILMLVVFGYSVYGTSAAGIPVGSSGLTYQACLAFADVFKTIPTSSNTYYYRNCYRATCSNGVYNRANMVSNSGYRCQNGNYDPYLKVSSDGCKSYYGSCSTYNSTYCTKVTFVDCGKMSDGSEWEPAPSSTVRTTRTTKKTSTTTKKKTTTKSVFTTVSKKTTKKTTTKKKTTTTTKFEPGVIKTTTTSSTTTTTTTTTKDMANTKIKKLIVDSFILEDKKKGYLEKTEYEVNIPMGIRDVDVKVTLVDKEATYTVTGNNDIPDGEGHVIVIEVVAADGVTKQNTVLKVVRTDKDYDNCYAQNIKSDIVSFEFDKKLMDYEVTIAKNVRTLDLDVILANVDSQTYEITGDESLKNNSKIEIEVRAASGKTCLYTIKVKKPSNTWKYIIIIILIIAAIVAGVYFFLKYLKKSKGTYKYE